MISALFSRLIILVFGNLYPAYASYKAVRTKNVKEYVKWMMYWIVFAFFTCIETCTDIFLSWFPFYYEIKILIVLWLLSPATKGSSTLYRKFVHPMLTQREQHIDEYINQARERGYSAVLQLGSKGVNYATNVIMQTAIKGGGNLVQTIRRSYSLSDLSEPDEVHFQQDQVDGEFLQPRRLHQHHSQVQVRTRMHTPVGRSASGNRHSTGMYFTESDLSGAARAPVGLNYNVRSSDDISSGYSSAEFLSSGASGSGLSRTASLTNASKYRAKVKRTEIPNMMPMRYFDPRRMLFSSMFWRNLNVNNPNVNLADDTVYYDDDDTTTIEESELENDGDDDDDQAAAIWDDESKSVAEEESSGDITKASLVLPKNEKKEEIKTENLTAISLAKKDEDQWKKVDVVKEVVALKEEKDSLKDNGSDSDENNFSDCIPFTETATASAEATRETPTPVISNTPTTTTMTTPAASPKDLMQSLAEIHNNLCSTIKSAESTSLATPNILATRPRTAYLPNKRKAPPPPTQTDNSTASTTAIMPDEMTTATPELVGRLLYNYSDDNNLSRSSSYNSNLNVPTTATHMPRFSKETEI